MEISKLYGLGTENNRGYFILQKTDDFMETFNEILKKLKIEGMIYKENGPISDRNNEIDHFKNNLFDIDIIYSKDRIILIVRAGMQSLENFKSIILAHFKMEE